MSGPPDIPKFIRRVLGMPDPETKRRLRQATDDFDRARESLTTTIEETVTEEIEIDIPPPSSAPETVPPER